MIPTLQNMVEYVPKNRSTDLDHLDHSVLETLQDMKKLYQVESAQKDSERRAEVEGASMLGEFESTEKKASGGGGQAKEVQ